jgi:hypothetical protein
MVDATIDGRTHRLAKLVERNQPPGYHLGSLENSRIAFAAVVGFAFNWDEADDLD